MTRQSRRMVAVALTTLILFTGGCTKKPAESGQAPPTAAPASTAVAYGQAPTSGGDVAYQPDVVLVGGGPASIRAVSRDYLTWTIDARAPHADQLTVGKVMFLTNRAVGRVMALQRQGDDLAVTLGPVDFGDVIRDGTLAVNRSVDQDAFAPLTYDGVGGLADVTELTSAATPGSSPSSGFAPASLRLPPGAARDSGSSVSVGDFTLGLSNSSRSGLALRIAYSVEGVVFGGTVTVGYSDVKVDSNLRFSGGKLVNGSRLLVSGINKVAMSMQSGSEQGLSRNVKARIEVPVEWSIQVPTEPVPLVLTLRMKFILETAFSAKNGNLTANGELAIDGPIGFTYNDGFNAVVPTTTQVASPVDTMSGVSVGVNAVVFAAQTRVSLGIGIPAANTAASVALTMSYGMTLGSSAGIVQCRQASLDVIATVGLGLTLDPKKIDWLKSVFSVLSPVVPRFDSDLVSKNVPIVHEVRYKPPVTACG